MPDQPQTAQTAQAAQTERAAQTTGGKRPQSPQEERERKQRVLTQNMPSVVGSIADAVVVKDEDLFFLAEPNGQVPLGGEHGDGLYYHDCRFLGGYELRLAGTHPDALVSTAARGFVAVFQLTNQEIRLEDGRLVGKQQIGIKWMRTIDSAERALHDLITLHNFGLERVELPLALTFEASFQDVFAIRGLLTEQPGTPQVPRWRDGVLHFGYDGADGLYRSLAVHFSPAPEASDGTTAHFRVALEPRGQAQLLVSLVVAEAPERGEVRPRERQPDLRHVHALLNRSVDDWLGKETEIRSDSIVLNGIVERSLRDLRVLRNTLDGQTYFAAGIPWFGTLFGRDSLITALEALAFDPEIAAQTLRVLAARQGTKVDEWRDEQPGKILHELRVGELARMGEIPHTPYYGTIDAAPLFLILLGRHAAWRGDLTLFHELRENVERALDWITRYGDSDGDGYLEYHSSSEKGLINQGWKDSGDAIVDADGSLAEPPISLVEVQGYVYQAWLTVADLYERAGEQGRAEELRRAAADLRARFNRDFWLEEQGFYALGLEEGNHPLAVRSSNPGHALWAGIADEERARRTADMLLAGDMFSGWGVRTLSDREKRYNPVGYHLGTVWPHDNALIAAGFRRYGFDAEARRVFTVIVEAATHFADYRLPELFAGFGREEYGVPVHYPVACHPQAWAAGAVPYLLETLLGLVPEAFERRLRLVRPALPDFVDRLAVHRLTVGDAQVSLQLDRVEGGGVAVKVLGVDGDLDVVVDS